jgi:hypothetical protein
MRIDIPATIILSLLAASVGAQNVLYENPYNPAGVGDAYYSSGLGGGAGCAFSGVVCSAQDAQSFTLTRTDTVESVSIIVTDENLGPEPSQRYNWSIYAAANGLPTGSAGPLDPSGVPVALPIASSAGNYVAAGNGQPGTFTYLNLLQSPPAPGDPFGTRVNEVTIDTGPVTLGPGTYFFAISGEGSELSLGVESWDAGLLNSGAAWASYGNWSPGTSSGASGSDGLAMTVIGTPAPEINPSSATSALTLLFAGVMILRGRRRD